MNEIAVLNNEIKDLKNLTQKNSIIQKEKADLAEEVKNLMVII